MLYTFLYKAWLLGLISKTNDRTMGYPHGIEDVQPDLTMLIVS